MDWLNIHRSTLQSDVMLDVEPQDGWTWLRLLSYCAQQENGGRLAGARAWDDRKWQRSVQISKPDVDRLCALWRWEEEDLLVQFYPIEKEKWVAERRSSGQKGARQRWHPKKAQPIAKPLAEPKAQPIAKPLAEPKAESMAELMRKGKEGKGKEWNGREEEGSLDSEIPSLDEVLTWANGQAGVDPEYAKAKWSSANENHAWVLNGRLIDWRRKWKRFWEEDREAWFSKKKSGAKSANAGAQASDPEWWWTAPLEMVDRALQGALLSGVDTAQTARLREVLTQRRDAR